MISVTSSGNSLGLGGLHNLGLTNYMETKYRFYWYHTTFERWSTPIDERSDYRGNMFDCMEYADSQCADVTFKLAFNMGILTKILVLIAGIESGVIFPE
jgi:hypothetical protein